VKIAGAFGIPYLATGGGHGLSTTLNKLKDGISIDLGNFKKVTVDTRANAVTVGGANVFADVLGPVWDAGREMSKFTKNTSFHRRL
jgi:FAD/FMN-containing dehydrogenase